MATLKWGGSSHLLMGGGKESALHIIIMRFDTVVKKSRHYSLFICAWLHSVSESGGGG